MAITYRKLPGLSVEAYSVFVDGRRTGIIRKGIRGYQYRPDKSNEFSEHFETLDKCKQSLEL